MCQQIKSPLLSYQIGALPADYDRIIRCTAERWVRTVRAEVTDRMLIIGPRHLRAALDRYAVHYSCHRPHRARNLRPPDCGDTAPAAVTDLIAARIRRRGVLGRLINEYERAV